MRTVSRIVLAAACAAALALPAAAQAPGGKAPDAPARDKKDYSNDPLVTRMMAFDKNKDGKLTKDEVTDERLHRLFDRADANKDGVVTKEELAALAAAEAADQGEDRGGRGGPGGRGPGGPGGPGGRGGPGGGGPGGFGGPPQPGQVLPPFLQERLNLTDEQKKQLEELQKEVDSKLGKILTDDQKKQLKEMPQGFGPGGPGGRGPGGPGGRGPGGPPGGEGGRPMRPE
jgi:Spy/CpxP family protein refolding chaperone